jgi:predicted peroxiredoxin
MHTPYAAGLRSQPQLSYRLAPVKILYLSTAGAADPTRASLSLHIAANGSVAEGQECGVVLVGDATELVSRETAERIEGVGIPPARELVQKLLDNRVPIFV